MTEQLKIALCILYKVQIFEVLYTLEKSSHRVREHFEKLGNLVMITWRYLNLSTYSLNANFELNKLNKMCFNRN